MSSLILSVLRFFARKIIEKHTPYVIGVTGTVGKTTITENIALALSLVYNKEDIGSSPYHYNGEYGLPLTIIGAKTGGKNPLLWVWAFLHVIPALLTKKYPKYLILEYGIDHPGEMEYMLSIVKPDIAILSPVAPNHLEQFGNFERYLEAKLLLIESAKSSRIAHESHREHAPPDTYFYGNDSLSIAHILSFSQSLSGSTTTLSVSGNTLSLSLPSF
jgi:UDP-N-acetylmuramoyl-tripeptide--D-alanyl-D-alanine ligase